MIRIDAEQYGGLCTCGEEHHMATRLCVIGADVLVDFDALMAEVGLAGRRCVVYDQHTYGAKNLRRVQAEQEIVLDPEGLHANEDSTAEVLRQLAAVGTETKGIFLCLAQ